MAERAQLSSAVMFVQNLTRSVHFYTHVLELEVTDRSTTAALLTSEGGSQLVLRAVGGHGNLALGGLGVQYVIWTVAGDAALDRCEQALKDRGALIERRTADEGELVEGRDPDGIAVMIACLRPDHLRMSKLPSRVYGW
ncbi:MAG TPA: VOC family protein [Streptosporangiaceae bacterium]|jgi:catechol 2,3-dioxygenase-like lactoylglutathione lyase family enzyme